MQTCINSAHLAFFNVVASGPNPSTYLAVLPQ